MLVAILKVVLLHSLVCLCRCRPTRCFCCLQEFFLLLLTEILDPKYGMFIHIEESKTIWFNDQVKLALVH